MSGAEYLYEIGYISGKIQVTERYRKLKLEQVEILRMKRDINIHV